MNIKKSLFFLILCLGVALSTPVLVYAANSNTDVTGVITINGNAVSGANVVVVCNNHSLTAITDSKGVYSVSFSASDCPDGAKATVVATQNNYGGVTTGPITSGAASNLSVDIINNSVPEFGVIAGYVTAIAGGIVFLIVRRKEQTR